MKKLFLLLILLTGCAASTYNKLKPTIIWENTGKSVFEQRENYTVTGANTCVVQQDGKTFIKRAPC